MKTRIAIISAAIIGVMTLTSTSYAAFASVKTEVRTASVNVGGASVVDFTLNLRPVVNPVASPDSPEVTWSGVSAGSTWKIADVLLMVNATITDLAGGIQIYTDNRGTGANPTHVDLTPAISTNTDSNPAGLLLDDGSGTASRRLDLAWSVKDAVKTIDGTNPATGIIAADPNTGPDTGTGNRFQWLFMKDKNTPAIDFDGNGAVGDPGDGTAFVNGEDFATVFNVDGIHFGQAPTEFGIHPDGQNAFIYLQANFATALPGLSYKTNKLTLEAYTL